MVIHPQPENEAGDFVPQGAIRGGVIGGMERLLGSFHFTGRVSIVVQNGRVLKSGYEGGYFRRKQ